MPAAKKKISKKARIKRLNTLRVWYVKWAVIFASRGLADTAANYAKRAILSQHLIYVHEAQEKRDRDYAINSLLEECQAMAPRN